MTSSTKYSLATATSIVVANMIGTGVFTSLGFQLLDINNMTTIVLLWVLGGVIAVLGSFCYAELSASYPRSGGEYHFLRISFGKSIGFLSGWTSAVVGFAAPIAASAFAFSKYFTRVIDTGISPVLLSIFIVLIITAIHSFKVHIGAKFQVFFTSGKILLLIFFIIAGLNYVPATEFKQTLDTGFNWLDFQQPGFWIGLIFVSYAYSGWNASAYIIDDIRNPIKNVPRSIFIGTFLVTILYVLINYVFMISAEASALKGKEEIAHIAASYIFGQTGATIVSAMVSFFLISTIGSMVIVGPRVIKRMASDYPEFSFFAKDNKNGIPVRAILLQSMIAILLLLTSSFEFIITAIGFVLCIFTTLTAIGLIYLRYKNPEQIHPIRVPLFPITPLLFIGFNLWTMGYLFINRQKEVAVGLGFVVIGYFLYLFLSKSVAKKSAMVAMLPLALFIHGCNDSKDTKEKTVTSEISTVESPKTVSFQKDTILDNRAFEIAGLSKSGFNDSSTPYAIQKLNSIWALKTQNILNPIRQWSSQITPNDSKPKLVFYPFSGPDFEFANAYYPEADMYIMCGLEKAGNQSSYLFNHKVPVDSFIGSAEKYFYYADRFGFFRTLDMEAQFEKYGVVDILALYIKRAGAEIGNAELLTWNSTKGTLENTAPNGSADVCHFTFKFPSGKISSLYYFSKDLSDHGLSKDSTWFNWVSANASGKQMYSLTKSASYLMHTQVFTKIRDYVLNNSQFHIQDDSGLKYQDMVGTGKQVKIFGRYSAVIPVFSQYLQKDLAEKYKQDSVPSLPFRIGYNLRHQETCLQVMMK